MEPTEDQMQIILGLSAEYENERVKLEKAVIAHKKKNFAKVTNEQVYAWLGLRTNIEKITIYTESEYGDEGTSYKYICADYCLDELDDEDSDTYNEELRDFIDADDFYVFVTKKVYKNPYYQEQENDA
jgi:hypothetical protein